MATAAEAPRPDPFTPIFLIFHMHRQSVFTSVAGAVLLGCSPFACTSKSDGSSTREIANCGDSWSSLRY